MIRGSVKPQKKKIVFDALYNNEGGRIVSLKLLISMNVDTKTHTYTHKQTRVSPYVLALMVSAASSSSLPSSS